MNHEKPAYTIRETEQLLNLSHAKLYQQIGARSLRTYTVGRRRFVSAAAIDQFILDREAAATA